MSPRRKTGKAAPPTAPADIPARVKTAILLTYGMDNPDPGSLANTAAMSGFGFTDLQWMVLAGRLTVIATVYQPGQTITVTELQNTSTVQDCIDLVTPKTVQP